MFNSYSRVHFFGTVALAAGLFTAAPAVAQTLTPMPALRQVDADFQPTMLGQVVTVEGTVHGANQRSATQTGYQAVIIDANNVGVNVFSTTVAPATPLVEGDLVRVTGAVDFFRGLTEINFASISKVGTGTVVTPRIVNGPLTEADESSLVRIGQPVRLAPGANWTATGTAFTVDVVTAGGTTYSMRVPNGSDFAGMPAPTGYFTLTGTGNQFATAAPYNTGYQIFPRRRSDISAVSATKEAAFGRTLSIYPNPVANELSVAVAAEARNASYEVLNALGQRVQGGSLAATEGKVNVASLTGGVYMLRLTTADGSVTRRFIKQ
ncbi:T9SS type A sorting domain-containing protein [Hymenobacter busanensis]|nr:T9SS type A sorting domain-containing protein [Hymenobacter busanensis]QHJ07297.1 T9SS type A sorting domain-containing protein [Hymenobacter busanensis]